jgi:DNA-binding protein H-NS
LTLNRGPGIAAEMATAIPREPSGRGVLRRPLPLQGNRSIRGVEMKDCDLKMMSVDELWALHEETVAALASKIMAEKARLEQRLHELGRELGVKKMNHARRPYPQVFPKYRNPAEPAETWAGRGKQPRWLAAQLRSGKKLDDFRIQPTSHRARRHAG